MIDKSQMGQLIINAALKMLDKNGRTKEKPAYLEIINNCNSAEQIARETEKFVNGR